MRTRQSTGFILLLIGVTAAVCTTFAQTTPTAGLVTGTNLAVVAKPSSSHVSGDTTAAALNDGYDPRNSRDARRGSYGNWPTRGTQWVQYDWSQPISTGRIDVYWWADGRGVHAPKACRLLTWDGNAFVPVDNPSGLGVAVNQYNTTSFDEVRTSKLKLEIDANDTFSTGILEWKVIDSGKSPDFPPMVTAGIDRIVVLGGKTYLGGTVKTLKGGGVTTTWSKSSGPGTITFENAKVAVTTATFSKKGEYVLQLAAAKGPLSASSMLTIQVVSPPPADRLDVVYTKKYKIDSPLWNSRAKALIVNWIPHCIDQINNPNLKEGQGGIDNFIEAAKALRGEPHGRHKGYVFSNAWVHQTIESMCIALMVDPKGDPEIIKAQEKMKATLEDWIPKIFAAQEPDGYLQTAYTLADRNRWPQRWNPPQRGNHEGYVAGYFIESAINHYTLTNGTDKRLYNAAKKLADCWVANLGPAPKKPWFDGHQEMEQALVRFGRFVNDMEGPGSHGDSYIKLAKFLLDSRKDGSEYDQSHVPVQQQYEAVGHAVRASYTYSGMADVAAETHDVDYQSAVMSLWDNMVNKKYYVTGGVGSGETSEGFGPNYSLRQSAYNESCSTCGLIFFQYKMNLAYHDAKYADLYEESLYNALLGSIDLEGKNFYYDNPLDSHGPRYPWHVCPCCVGNIPRTLLMIPTWTYVKGKDGLYVNLFIGSTINVEKVAGTNVQMVQETDYPWSGKVAITVNPETAKRFAVCVRVPNRTTSELYTPTPQVNGLESISVNGSTIKPKIENGYAVITRKWKAEDKIVLMLPMKVQRIKASDKIAATAGKVALRYGPLIYSAEAVDQSLDKVLAPDSALTTEWKGDLLDGVMVVKGTWADGSALMAVPNYARDNRLPQSESAAPTPRRGPRSISSAVWLKDR
ncbi:MAG: glycoside hydrolase family 127 protein [Phycisphaerae bacterium]|nr:glycoside hydrolase family 127 protein [Phycisphaerae bacterium]